MNEAGRLRFRHYHAIGAAMLALLMLILLGACATPTEQRFIDLATSAGLERGVIAGERFEHVYYRARPSTQGQGEPLHVYLEGDGTPWLAPGRPSTDPTPRNPVAFELLLLDPGPALLLARPCTHGLASTTGCHPLIWTHRRYAPEVVASLAAALRHLAGEQPIVLIGFSGGGVLAWLLAERLPNCVALVTLASNLDVEQWRLEQGYSPLIGSLNPATRPPLRPQLIAWYLFGADDQNVTPLLAQRWQRRHPTARVELLPGVDHRCCWSHRWPRLLRELKQQLIRKNAR